MADHPIPPVFGRAFDETAPPTPTDPAPDGDGDDGYEVGVSLPGLALYADGAVDTQDWRWTLLGAWFVVASAVTVWVAASAIWTWFSATVAATMLVLWLVALGAAFVGLVAYVVVVQAWRGRRQASQPVQAPEVQS